MKFLVVDDSAIMRSIITNSLRRIGWTDCVEAESGEAALACCDATIQFVIADWHMPTMSGADLLAALRRDGHRAPMLLVAPRATREDGAPLPADEATDAIVKPFTPRQLKEKIDALVDGRVAALR